MKAGETADWVLGLEVKDLEGVITLSCDSEILVVFGDGDT